MARQPNSVLNELLRGWYKKENKSKRDKKKEMEPEHTTRN